MTLDSNKFNPIFSSEGEEDGETGVVTRQKYERPKMWKVILHNDDYTTMEFVIHILKSVFLKTELEAEAIMLEVHEKGFGICGVYTYEIAETKQVDVTNQARENRHPLKCSFEEE